MFEQKIQTLREIRINNNGIFTEGLVEFVKAVAKNPLLEVIDVSDNHLNTRGGIALAKAIKFLPHLRVLAASDTGLKDRAGEALVQSLAGLSSKWYWRSQIKQQHKINEMFNVGSFFMYTLFECHFITA